MNKEKIEEVHEILELGKHHKNLHHKKGFGGLLFIDLSMIKFSKLSSYIRFLEQENQQLKEKLECSQTNEETYRLEMLDITKILGLKEDELFDDVKKYANNLCQENEKLEGNWNMLKKYIEENLYFYSGSQVKYALEKMQELEKGEMFNV